MGETNNKGEEEQCWDYLERKRKRKIKVVSDKTRGKCIIRRRAYNQTKYTNRR